MTPLIRNNRGILQEATYEEAVKAIVENISGKETAGIVSSRLPHETLDAFRGFIKTKPGGGIIDTTDGEIFRTISSCLNKDGNLFGDESTIADIPDGDYILIIGADPQMTNPVISTVIRRTVNKSKAKLAIINEEADVLPRWSYLWMNPVKGTEGQLIRGVIKTIVSKGWSEHEIDSSLARELESVDIDTVAQQCHVKRDDIEELARDYSQASKAVIIYGDKLLSSDTSAVSGIATLVSLAEGKSASMLLKPEANSRGAWDKGLAEGITGKPESFYLLLGDDMADEKLLKQIDGAGYLVVQASYPSPVTEKADVVIPSPIWSERSGSYTTIDGRNVTARSVVTPAITVKQDAEFLKSIMAESGMRIR
jgi:predicted molibdopterin-dependent oxidoreductase YjgC